MKIKMTSALRSFLLVGGAVTSTFFLSSCGGDDSSSPTPTPSNKAPTFTSTTTASTVENKADFAYTAAATDPEGSALTFSVSGGADAAAFAFSGTTLKFVSPPNFDLPDDANADNVYEVQLQVSDGQARTTLDLRVSVTNSKEGIALTRVATGFVDPVAIVPVPGSTSLFVAERGGAIYTLDPATGQKTLFYALTLETEGERGLQAIAVSPNYVSDGRFYAVFGGWEGRVFIRACRRQGQFLSPSCGEAVLSVAAEVHEATNNYAASMATGPDGKLYVVTSDGGGSRDPAGTAQSDASILGKLLRVDNNPDPYAGVVPMYYVATRIAKGFRNPRGASFTSGLLLVADRGETGKEEINLVSTSDAGNYGWPAKEGTSVVLPPAPKDAIDPVIEYTRPEGGGVVGGFVYRGSAAPLRDQYVFADKSGIVFSVPRSKIVAGVTLGAAALERRTADFAPDQGTLDHPAFFGEDLQGELYVVDADGDVFRVGSAS
jgi:glucose/arabinose dehydrogenase